METGLNVEDVTFHIALCEDEDYYLDLVEGYIRNFMDIKGYFYEIDRYHSAEEFLSCKENLTRYDILYLDVVMDFLTGFDIADAILETGRQVYLIFVTRHISYASEGYKVKAFRFILKDPKTIEYYIQESLYTITSKVFKKSVMMKFHFIGGNLKLNPDWILYIESNLRRLTFHIYTHKLIVLKMNGKLNDIEERLSGMNFLRVHQSFLVNMYFIQKISRYEVELAEGTLIPITKKRYPQVVKEYAKYQSFF